MKGLAITAMATAALLALPANVDQAQCDRARAADEQWKTEQCLDPFTALTLRMRVFANKHYGGSLNDVEWDFLTRNPPPDQRAEIEAMTKKGDQWRAKCGPGTLSPHWADVRRFCWPAQSPTDAPRPPQ